MFLCNFLLQLIDFSQFLFSQPSTTTEIFVVTYPPVNTGQSFPTTLLSLLPTTTAAFASPLLREEITNNITLLQTTHRPEEQRKMPAHIIYLIIKNKNLYDFKYIWHEKSSFVNSVNTRTPFSSHGIKKNPTPNTLKPKQTKSNQPEKKQINKHYNQK